MFVLPIRVHQEGLQCDGYAKWQHRTCQTGISQAQYREAERTGHPIDGRFVPCAELSLTLMFILIGESTRLEDSPESDLNSTVYDPPANMG